MLPMKGGDHDGKRRIRNAGLPAHSRTRMGIKIETMNQAVSLTFRTGLTHRHLFSSGKGSTRTRVRARAIESLAPCLGKHLLCAATRVSRVSA